MYRFTLAALIAAPLLMAAPAFAATDIPLPPFTAISVHGGGHITLMHGPTQRVTLIKGDPKVAQLTVHDNKLDVSPCPTICPFHNTELEVEIVSPKIESIEAHGGGALEAKGNFPKQPIINVEAHGGGAIDVRAIAVDVVNASAHGGGAIHVKALSVLNASAHGGGAISYAGNPPQVSSSTHGGGAISHE